MALLLPNNPNTNPNLKCPPQEVETVTSPTNLMILMGNVNGLMVFAIAVEMLELVRALSLRHFILYSCY